MKRCSAFPVLLLSLALFLMGCGSSSETKPATVITAASLEAVSTEYPNGDLLVSADSLAKSLGSSGLIVIDARSKTAYDQGHIPGAINLQHSAFWTRGSGLKAVADLQTLLGNAGIGKDGTYVVYDDTTASWGAAGRIFWMLEYLGCRDVHLLDGGWDKWIAEKRGSETSTRTLAPVTFTAAVDNTMRATKQSILNRLQNKDFLVIDARTDEEYLGWQIYGEARGGHIPGAVNIPYAWFYNSDKTVLSYDELKALFESRGITSDKDVTANCTVGIRSGFVYFALRLMGYSRASNYDASIVEWAADSSYPLEQAPNFSRIVYPGWVKSLIKGETPATFPAGNGYVVFECSWGPSSSAYNTGHIPGAIHFDTNNVEARDYLNPDDPAVSDANEIVWDLVKDSLLQERLRNMGISDNTTVIVYGKSASAATRIYWAMRYAGVDVRYLNGGYSAWIGSGGEAETTAHTPPAVGNVTVNPQNQIKALTPEVLTYAEHFRTNGTIPEDTIVVDVRKMEEYIGAVVGYNDPNITRKGRIPGAVWGYEAAKAVYQDADETLRSFTEIRDLWEAQGITSDKTLIFYCGTGWRSTLAFLYADVMGFPDIKNYDSWYVWATFYEQVTGTIHRDAPFNDPAMPVDTGWPEM
ncbi:MAG: rhodanese-like domain-containing protein [Pseudomonadota bacterium]